uniref:Uncharacterized protein n=1 Tax=Triticum urartu TaxID=4572 RepID=A0A8R7Q8D6_TRIUA
MPGDSGRRSSCVPALTERSGRCSWSGSTALVLRRLRRRTRSCMSAERSLSFVRYVSCLLELGHPRLRTAKALDPFRQVAYCSSPSLQSRQFICKLPCHDAVEAHQNLLLE